MAPEMAGRECRFVQDNADRRRIFALVVGAGEPALGFGPLGYEQINEGLFVTGYRAPWLPQGDPSLAASLFARRDEWHDLDDFFRFYGYPQETVAWVESTPPEGRPWAEVAARLGLDPQRLREAASEESIVAGARDPAGDWVYHQGFGANWAVGSEAGVMGVNPNAYRFKAYLSLSTSV